jgi:hypothetical protein
MESLDPQVLQVIVATVAAAAMVVLGRSKHMLEERRLPRRCASCGRLLETGRRCAHCG